MIEDKLFSKLTFVTPGRLPRQMNALALAYIGDAVFELYVRQHLLSETNHKPHHLHRRSVRYVSAVAQSLFLEKWWPLLDEEEVDVVKRGRNANSGTVPKNVEPLIYRRATGFESLVGYLYLERRFDRLNELIALILDSEV
jgi:ribonuclease-3 family protein